MSELFRGIFKDQGQSPQDPEQSILTRLREGQSVLVNVGGQTFELSPTGVVPPESGGDPLVVIRKEGSPDLAVHPDVVRYFIRGGQLVTPESDFLSDPE